MTDHRVANQRMLDALMVIIIQSDDHMIKFCDAVLDLCSRDKFCNELVEFTKGKLTYFLNMIITYVCICTYVHNYTLQLQYLQKTKGNALGFYFKITYIQTHMYA